MNNEEFKTKFQFASSWDPLEGATATQVIVDKFSMIFVADLLPRDGEDLKAWMVDSVENGADTMSTAALNDHEIVARIRAGVEDDNDPLLALIENQPGADYKWHRLDPSDAKYPYLDLAVLLEAIADEMEEPGSVRNEPPRV